MTIDCVIHTERHVTSRAFRNIDSDESQRVASPLCLFFRGSDGEREFSVYVYQHFRIIPRNSD